jgi:hypothetical protein
MPSLTTLAPGEATIKTLDAKELASPCISPKCKSGHPKATWLAIEQFPCHPTRVGPVCDGCAAMARRWIAEQVGHPGPFRCTACGVEMRQKYVELLTLKPIS